MFYLISERANIGKKIITEEHPIIQMHLKESDPGWDAERIIQWMWGFEKKTENVFDLIDKGDLLKLNLVTSECTVKPTIEFVDDMIFKGIHFNEDVIAAIYKPDSKGNYIKVWDRDEQYDR